MLHHGTETRHFAKAQGPGRHEKGTDMSNVKKTWIEKNRWDSRGSFRSALYECPNLTPKGERIVVELTKSENDPKDSKTMPNRWYKKGWIPEKLNTYWSVTVYAYDGEGNCFGRYNPQVKMEEGVREAMINGKMVPVPGPVIDFDWIFEATPENAAKLFSEIERRAFSETEEG